MTFQPVLRAISRRDATSPESAASALRIELVPESAEDASREYHGRITNPSDRPVFLEKAVLLDLTDLSCFGLAPGPYTVFRSGRHKNDLPGVFETECPDERLKDVSSVMAESGGSTVSSGAAAEVVSDHLTLIRDRAGKCLAVEFMTGRDQLFQTRLELDDRGRLCRLVSETLFRIQLDPGACVRTETLRVAVTDDPEAETALFARRKAALYGSRNQRHPAVFCTWYYYGLTVTLGDVLTNLRIIRDRKLPYQVFQVDEGWEITLGEYEPNAKFPISMRELADRIRESGLEPGLWSSPFVAHETATVWKRHPEWMLRDGSGRPCLFPMNDTVYCVFDITHPGTWAYFRELYRLFTFDWGYTYHKLDFTRAAVIYEDARFHDPKITLAQAYYQAVKAIREGMGEDAFLLMCGGLYDPIIGLVDAQRTGSDVLSMWSSNIHKDGKTAPYTIRQSLARFYMNEWWANDPDALMVRRNPVMERGLRLTYGLLTDDEVSTSVLNQFAGGGIVCQTEPLDRIEEDRLMELRHLLPVPERRVRPLSLMSGARFPESVDVYLPETGAHCVCLINWSDTECLPVAFSLRALPLAKEQKYTVCDFYSGEYREDVSAGETVHFQALKPHAATLLKVEAQQGRPIIVRSDGHYAMGAECAELRFSEGQLRVRIPALLPVETRLTILLPPGCAIDGERAVSLRFAPGQSEAVIG